jgi:hypothetical protein
VQEPCADILAHGGRPYASRPTTCRP